jgi:tRNA-uridine 2-sulfurtransferase
MTNPSPRTVEAGRIVVGLSGGVDSSVAALLLKQQGYGVLGVFMKNWEDEDGDGYCNAREDFLDAVAVAERLGIDIDAVNFAALYREKVFSDFLAEYQAGRTPNPDILCNTEIKFKAFLEHALNLGAERIATGHYSRSRHADGHYQLLKARDPGKDQSYFLHGLNQAQLSRTVFPLGEMIKPEVRKLAEQAGLVTHAKKDSTGICFIGERPFREFLSRYLAARPGEIRTLDEQRVGRHQGVTYYTLGQREGLGIGGIKGAREAPWYVLAKDTEHNVLYVGQDKQHPLLLSRTLQATRLTWISGCAPQPPFPCHAKTRYRQADQPCQIVAIADDRYEVLFEQPQWAVTPGQSVVFYDGELCLGGGIIASTDAS